MRILFVLCAFHSFVLAAVSSEGFPKIALQEAFTQLKLHLPVWAEQVPDGSDHIIIVEQEGRLVIMRKDSDGKDATEFLNIQDRKPHVDLEEGLLGLAFHPDFKTNRLFYIYYNQQNPRRSVISEFKVLIDDPNRADMKSERILMEVSQPFQNHKGGQVSFGPDGFLYIGLGDGGRGNDPFNNSQNTASLLGKILRIDVNTRTTVNSSGNVQTLQYGIPDDNPFVGEPSLYEYGVRKEIWAYGLRNPWRFSWDRETGEMWAGDVGQDQWEEVDLIVKGGNYGWCIREGFHHFKPGPACARYIDPVIEYPHKPELLAQSQFPAHTIGVSVTGGFVYRGKKYPALRGVYVYADYGLGTIWGFRYQQGKVTEHGILLEQPKNIASFAETLDGELYALAYDGHIYSLIVSDSK